LQVYSIAPPPLPTPCQPRTGRTNQVRKPGSFSRCAKVAKLAPMNHPKRLTALLAAVALCACASQPPPPDLADEAQRIADEHLIIDTHIDVPFRLLRNPADVSTATEDGDFDFPRARAGGLNAPFMSIYIPAAVDEAGGAFDLANELIDSVENLAASHPGKFAVATCSRDVEGQSRRGLMSLPMGMENGGPVAGRFGNLQHFYDRGIRYITLAHSKSNHISDSSYDPDEQWQGLSTFGKGLISEMNRLGVIIDVSHLSDKAFWQVLELSGAPVLATHSSLRHFTPAFQRNMSDEMVAALARKGGVIQINFGSSFLHQPAQDYGTARSAAMREYQAANNLADDDPALRAHFESYTAEHPYPYATVDTVLDHIDRAVEIAGIDAVGLGSDFDGVGDSLPVGLKDVSMYPNLIEGLLERGYSEEDIAKILGGNTLRVWRAVEAHAASKGTALKCAAG